MDYVRDFVSGFSGGCLSTAICHPFDLVRNRQAVQDGNRNRPAYNNQLSIVKSVIRNDGMRALWRGVTPSIIGAGLSWGLYFPIYNFITDNLRKHHKNNVPSYQVAWENFVKYSHGQHKLSLGLKNSRELQGPRI